MSEEGLDYGPLSGLVGRWQGSEGTDVAPEPEGDEESAYYETLLFEAAGDVDNADTQELSIVRYHQVVSRKRNDKVFHNESGYLTWEPAASALSLSFTIPRMVAVLAHGEVAYEDDEIILRFQSVAGTQWGMIESPFMCAHAHTRQFQREIRLRENSLTYQQTTEIEIYGRVVQHTDRNTLQRLD